MDGQQQINETVLVAYFNGGLPPAQRGEIEAWMERSEENRKIARDVQLICQASDALDCMRKVDSQEALKKVKGRIKISYKKLWMSRLQRIAALLAIPLLMATLYMALRKDAIEYIEIRTNPGMVAKVNLPDGTWVWLNSCSYMRHPVRFAGSSRDVLLSGEAYFSVASDKQKPFVVHTPFHIQAEVLGTEFNMEAYESEREVRTTLVSGVVKLTYRTDKEERESCVMKPGEEYVYNYRSGNIFVRQPYIPTLTAWKDRLVILRNTSFEEALAILSKRFNVKFVIKNVKLYENAFTGTFDGQHLQLILEHFRLSSGIQYRFIDPEIGNSEKVEEKSVVELY
ncbi:FecR family protein [Phocaeicola sp.]|uniref:FecR family protein n=1 Tax=Phocaeicola sp. TaxID=2773926 RepID=UPI0023CD7D13|nr:FecR family protein [Phocaeicola sp.]MDE5677255.1 FecR domain-containing protein [Phocaeicola sp.]